MKRAVLLKFVIEFFVAVAFFALLTVTLLHAYGFRYDILEKSLVKRTIVNVVNKVEDVEVYFDGEWVSDKLPAKVFDVEPGKHVLRVQKEGFNTWEREFTAQEDLVSSFDNVYLFPSEMNDFALEMLNDVDRVFYVDSRIFYLEEGQFFEFHVDDLEDEFLFELDSKFAHGIKTVQVFDDAYAFFYSNKKPVYIAEDRTERILNIPLSVKSLVSFDNSFWFLSSGNLMRYDLSLDKYSAMPEFLSVVVEDFQFFDGKFYLQFKDTLFTYDVKSSEVTQLFEDLKIDSFDLFKNQRQDRNYFALKLKDKVSAFYEQDGESFELIDQFYPKQFLASSDGSQVLYADDWSLKLYDLVESKATFLTRFSKRIEDLAWFGDSYFIYEFPDKEVNICTLDLKNCYNLWKGLDSFKYIVDREAFISFSEKGLKVYETDFEHEKEPVEVSTDSVES